MLSCDDFISISLSRHWILAKMNFMIWEQGIDLLTSLDFVASVKIGDEAGVTSSTTAFTSKKPTFFEKYNGAIPNLDVVAFENYINQTRNEWERDTY